jgi:hypothetical protein
MQALAKIYNNGAGQRDPVPPSDIHLQRGDARSQQHTVDISGTPLFLLKENPACCDSLLFYNPARAAGQRRSHSAFLLRWSYQSRPVLQYPMS